MTGGNKGIGQAICKRILCHPDTHVLLGSRNQTRGDKAVQQILGGWLKMIFSQCIKHVKKGA